MTPRSTAKLAGAMYLLTHVTSVGAVIAYGGSGLNLDAALRGRGSVLAGGLLEVVLAVAVVATSVALYPLLRPFSRGLATGYVAFRTVEASVILTGVLVILPVVARPGTDTAPSGDPAVGEALRLIHDWSFLVGPGLICPVNTVVLAWLLLRHNLVPRWITVLGLVGGPLIGLVNTAVLFGWTSPQPLAALPIFGWEIALAVRLIVRGLPTFTLPQPMSATMPGLAPRSA